MNDPVVVVGSGASGIHFALHAIERGRRVVLLDVGHERPEPVRPDLDLNGLKAGLDDPLRYFLGEEFESLILPGHDGEYYGFPPSRDYVFRNAGDVTFAAKGFAPLFSFATGGLAEAWTGGSYPFNEHDLREFPFGLEELLPHYADVARRIGVSGAPDDLAPFFPVHDGLQEPLDLDLHSRVLMDSYGRHRESLNRRFRLHMGRSRSAVLSRELDGRPPCDQLGRCLWGCPTDAFYTPSVTLRTLLGHERFEYVRGMRVRHFETDDACRVRRVVATDVAAGAERAFDVGSLVLAAGTLCTAKIFLDSVLRETGEARELEGLSDNRQIMMPFVNLRVVGRRFEPRSYQYHQLAMALEQDDPFENVHGLVTTLKTALIHPIVQSIPSSLGTALGAFRDVHAALGLLNVNFADRRRATNRVTVEPSGEADGATRLVVSYTPEPGEPERVRRVLGTLRKALRKLGCVAPKGMTHQRPMGASVHYTGTLPMTNSGGTGTVDPTCRSRDFENLWIADGSTFPALPAKNLTFTLMANARRIAAACC